MPVSKKRKKDGKPVHRQAAAGESHQEEHPEGHPDHGPQKVGGSKPRNPFVAQQSQHRGSQRGR